MTTLSLQPAAAAALAVALGCSAGRGAEGVSEAAVSPEALPPPGTLVVVRPPVAIAGLCEPSGAARLPDGRILVVDDDQEDHVFAWTAGAAGVEALDARGPAGEAPWRDPEGLAVGPDGGVWVMGSHSRSASKGKVGRRGVVAKLAIGPGVSRPVAWTDRLRPGKDPAELAPLVAAIAAVCPACALPAGVDGVEEGHALDLEGLAVRGPETLLVGLRAPLAQHRAVAFEVNWGPLVAGEPLERAVTQAWSLDLGGRGVRDLGPLPDGELLVLAGPIGSGASPAPALYRWLPGEPPRLLGELPDLGIDGSPEAVVPDDAAGAWVFYDEGSRLGDACKPGAPHPGGAHALQIGWTP